MSNSDNPFNHIVLPTQIPSAWPPAPIYWLLAVVVIISIILAFWFINKRIKQQALVKMALHSLQQLDKQPSSFAQLNQLLKALALRYYPRSEVAGLTGKDWYTFIEQHNPTQQVLFENMESFCQRLYQQPSMVKKQDIQAASVWIKAFPKQVSLQKKLIKSGAAHA